MPELNHVPADTPAHEIADRLRQDGKRYVTEGEVKNMSEL